MNNRHGDRTGFLDSQRRVIHNKRTAGRYCPVYVNGSACLVCKGAMMMDTRQTIRTCTKCAIVSFRLEDSLVPTQAKKAVRLGYYNRCTLYRKYIEQFYEQAPPIPQVVISTICRELFNVHIMCTNKCRPTPVANILRMTNNSQWVSYAVKITRLINNDPPVVFSGDLINRLHLRCSILSSLDNEDGLKCKFMNFEFLTKQFLCMENELQLAQAFHAHKTPEVLHRAENRLADYCARIPTPRDMPWFVTFAP